MPLDNLPLDLQKRLEASKYKTKIDLSGCNLSWLSEEKFQALVDVIHQHEGLKELSLKNCALAYLDSEKLEALLIGLSNLKVLDLSDNQLCFYELIGTVLDISTHLPRLTKLLFWDEPHSAWIPTLFSSLKKLPLFRLYEKDKQIYFLNDDEANLLLEAIRTEEKMAQYYFGEPSPVNVTSEEISHSSSNPNVGKNNQSQPAHGEQNKTGTSNDEADKAILPASLKELINSYPNIKNWHNSHGNKIFSMPPPLRPVLFCSNNFLVKENLQMAGAIHFIDQLQVPGLSLRYFPANQYTSTESLFRLDIDQGFAASFEQLMVALINADSFFQEMHARCFSEPSKAAMGTAKRWQLMIPPYAISQVALDLFFKVYKKYREHLEVRLSVKTRPENYQGQREKLSKRPTNVKTATNLTRSFVPKNEFYDLTQNSQKLDDFISQIKSLFDAKATKYQVYEFFIVHQLSIISGIATLEELQTIMNISKGPEANHEDSTNAKKQLQTLKQEIQSLFQTNSEIERKLREQLDANLLQIQQRPQSSRARHMALSGTTQASTQTRDTAKEQILAKARAWWGVIAFQQNTRNVPAGLYWYGRYLEQFPLREKYSQNVRDAVIEPVEQSGFYWLRIAAIRYSHLPSQQYLRQALGILQAKANERKTPLSQFLSPADYYQLMFACEVLDGTIKDQQIISPGHLAKLFSEITFSDIVFERKELYSSRLTEQHNPISVFFLVTAYLTKDAYFWLTQTSLFWEFLKSRDYLGSRAYSTNYLRKVQFYLYYLITDHLINEPARAHYLEQLKKQEPRGIVAAQLAPPLKKAVDAVIRYHSIPLARQLKRELLPRLKMHCNFKEKVVLDSEQPMKNHALEERRQAFCELLVEQLRVYLKEGRLFNVAIHEQENPCFIAAIMQNLFTEALDYFELQETSFAKEIHAVLQKIKDDADNSFLNQQPESHFPALGFKETLSQRLHSYATAAKVSNVVKLKILPAYAALSSEDDSSHQETTLLTKLVYGGAALVEVGHFALPIVAMISGIGIPAFLGTSALMQGLRHALKSVHHYAHAAEHALEASSLANMFVNLAHIHHLVHEAGLFPHEHREKRAKLIEEKVLVELDYLLSNASPFYREALAMLICHWDAVYRPITQELNEKSNVFLATLLVELFLRGLSFRLLAERLSLCERKRPQSSEEFIEFVEETIWRYSYPSFSDDMPLTTKNSQTFSALSVIFPNHLNAALNGKTECIFISSQLRPPYSLYKPCELIRHGSVYEIQQLNQCAKNKGLLGTPLFLVDARQSSMITRSLSTLTVTYEKPKALYEGFRLLAAKFNLQELKNKCNDCKDHYYLLLKEQQLSLEEKESAEKLQAQLITLNTILTQTLMQFDDKSLSHIQFLQDSLRKVGFLNSNHLDQYAIELFVDKAHAFLILLNNKYNLQLDFIPHLPLARENKTKLLSLVREHAEYFEGQGNMEENNQDTRKQPSISVSATVLPTYSIFAVNSSSDTASVVPRVMNNVLN